MSKKELKTRVQYKYDTAENWSKATFKSLKGEFYFYEPDENTDYARVKFGDGEHTVDELPFVGGTVVIPPVEPDVPDEPEEPELGSEENPYLINCPPTTLLSFKIDANDSVYVKVTAKQDGVMEVTLPESETLHVTRPDHFVHESAEQKLIGSVQSNNEYLFIFNNTSTNDISELSYEFSMQSDRTETNPEDILIPSNEPTVADENADHLTLEPHEIKGNYYWYKFTPQHSGGITLEYSVISAIGSVIFYDTADPTDRTEATMVNIQTFKVSSNHTYMLGLGQMVSTHGITVKIFGTIGRLPAPEIDSITVDGRAESRSLDLWLSCPDTLTKNGVDIATLESVEIYRKTSSMGTFIYVSTATKNTNPENDFNYYYYDTGRDDGQTYYYKIQSVSEDNIVSHWSDVKSATYYDKPVYVDPPTFETFEYTYNGEQQECSFTFMGDVIITGTRSATNAGTYTIKFDISSTNRVWSDTKDNSVREYTWKILPAPVQVTWDDTLNNFRQVSLSLRRPGVRYWLSVGSTAKGFDESKLTLEWGETSDYYETKLSYSPLSFDANLILDNIIDKNVNIDVQVKTFYIRSTDPNFKVIGSDGWEDDLDVGGTLYLTLTPLWSNFADNSWETIRDVVKGGNFSSLWGIGDSKVGTTDGLELYVVHYDPLELYLEGFMQNNYRCVLSNKVTIDGRSDEVRRISEDVLSTDLFDVGSCFIPTEYEYNRFAFYKSNSKIKYFEGTEMAVPYFLGGGNYLGAPYVEANGEISEIDQGAFVNPDGGFPIAFAVLIS